MNRLFSIGWRISPTGMMAALFIVAPCCLNGASTILETETWTANGHTYSLVEFDQQSDRLWTTAQADAAVLFGGEYSLATIASLEEA